MIDPILRRQRRAVGVVLVASLAVLALAAGAQSLAAESGKHTPAPGSSRGDQRGHAGGRGNEPSHPVAPNREGLPERDELAPGEIPQGPGCPYYEGEDLQLIV